MNATNGYEPTGACYIELNTAMGAYQPYSNNQSYPTATTGNNSTFGTSGTSQINFTDSISMDGGGSTVCYISIYRYFLINNKLFY